MPTLASAEYPRPRSWDEFEDICCDLFRREWNDPNTVRHGRNGQGQSGVDLYGSRDRTGPTVGAQCKLHAEGQKLTWDEVEAAVNRADAFTPTLADYTIATTAPRDADVQGKVRGLTQDRLAAGLFPVQILFWDDLCVRLADHPDLVRKHYPAFFENGGPTAAREPSRAEILAALATNTDAVAPRVAIPALGTIPRPELTTLETSLERRPVLLVGGGGTGKSGLVKLISDRARSAGSPVLVVDAAMLPSTAATPSEVGAALVEPLDIPKALRVASEGTAALFIVDQLDSVGGTDVVRALVVLLRAASSFGVRTLAVSRRYDANTVPEIAQLGFERVESDEISIEKAVDCLTAIGLIDPPEPVVRLGRNLLGLSLIADLVGRHVDVTRITGEVELWDAYRRDIDREDPSAEERAIELAWDTAAAGSRGVPLGGPVGQTTEVLLSRGVLDESSSLRYRFRHERIRDYLVAWDAARRSVPLTEILERLPEGAARGVFRWLHALLHAEDPEGEAALIRELLARGDLEFSTRAAVLEGLGAQADPDDRSAEAVLPFLNQPGYARLFFATLGPAWLLPLARHGGFSSTPSAGAWPALDYLLAQAATQSSTVADILEAVEIRSQWLIHDFLEIASRIPNAADAARATIAVARAVRVTDSPLSPLTARSATDLIKYLAADGEASAGIALLGALARPFIAAPKLETAEPEASLRQDARAALEEHDVKDLLRDAVPLLGEADVEGTRAALEGLLATALELEVTTDSTSWIWRPAIEDSAENLGFGHLKEHLLVALRNVAERQCRDHRDTRCDLIDAYLRHELSTFRRLGAHLLRLNRPGCPALVERAPTDPGFLAQDDLRHERFLLLAEAFGDLALETQRGYLECAAGETTEAGSKREEQAARLRLLNRLWPVRHALPPDWQGRLDELVAEFGEPLLAEYRARFSMGSGASSPLSADDLVAFKPDELIAQLINFRPSDEFLGPTRAGLAAELASAVQREPERFAGVGARFLDERLHPTFVSGFLRGLTCAITEGRAIPWPEVLTVCACLVDRPPHPEPEDESPLEANWATLQDVVRLVWAGLDDEAGAIPVEELGSTRDILIALTGHPDPTPERDVADEPMAVVINSVRREAVRSLIEYAVRRARRLDLPPDERLEAQVRAALEEHLDPAREPSVAVHAVFGAYYARLGWLDRDWLRTQTRLILPADPALDAYWQSAWEEYVCSGPVYQELFRELEPHYRRAIASAAQPPGGARRAEEADKCLGDSLALAYVEGWEELDDPNGRLALFLEMAPEPILSHVLWFLGAMLRDRHPTADSEAWQRLLAYWRARVVAAQARGLPAVELRQAALWLDDLPVGLGEIADLLEASLRNTALGWEVDHVVEYLARNCNKHPREAVSLLDLIDEAGSDRFRVGVHDHVIQILRAAFRSRSREAKAAARRFVNRRAEGGDIRYLPLLDGA